MAPSHRDTRKGRHTNASSRHTRPERSAHQPQWTESDRSPNQTRRNPAGVSTLQANEMTSWEVDTRGSGESPFQPGESTF